MKYEIFFVAIERERKGQMDFFLSQNQTSSNGIFITGEREKLVGDFWQHIFNKLTGPVCMFRTERLK